MSATNKKLKKASSQQQEQIPYWLSQMRNLEQPPGTPKNPLPSSPPEASHNSNNSWDPSSPVFVTAIPLDDPFQSSTATNPAPPPPPPPTPDQMKLHYQLRYSRAPCRRLTYDSHSPSNQHHQHHRLFQSVTTTPPPPPPPRSTHHTENAHHKSSSSSNHTIPSSTPHHHTPSTPPIISRKRKIGV